MTTGNGEDTPISGPTRRLHRDVLDDGEDVTHCTDRQLLLRVANAQIANEVVTGQIMGAAARMETQRFPAVELRLGLIEERLAPNGEIEHRQRQTSSHAIEGVADTIAAKVYAEFHGPRGGPNNLTRESVLEIVKATIGEDKLQRFERDAVDRKKLRGQVTAGVITGIVLLFATAIVAEFHGRATAPQTVQSK